MRAAMMCANSFSNCFPIQWMGVRWRRKLSALRHLYRFLLLDKRIEHDPTLNIPLPKQWKVLPKALGTG